MSDNSLSAQNAKRKALREEGAMRGIDKNLLRNRPLADIEKTVAAYRQSVTPERAKEIEAERRAEIKAAVDDVLKRRDAPAAPQAAGDPGQWQQPRPAPVEPPPSVTPSTPFKPVDIPKVNPAEVIDTTPGPDAFPQPTIASALVASAADTPEWTPTIGSEVGGVLVQQAAGDTPAFVGGTSATAMVFVLDKITNLAKWLTGLVVPLPTVDGYFLTGVGTTSAVWTAGPDLTAILADISAIEAILATNGCSAGVYLKSDGAGGFSCGLPAATAATPNTLVARDGGGDIYGAEGLFAQVTAAANPGVDPYSVNATGAPITTDWSVIVDNGGGDTANLDGTGLSFGGTSPVADGTYKVGLGVTSDGFITTKGGTITAITQAA